MEQEMFAETVDFYFPGKLAQLIWKETVLDSCILSQDHVSLINTWLNEENCGSNMKILYRASHDGWQASNFHAKCDNQ
eukprot:12155177-Ditylum_brightwellii.AAC.1